MGVVVDTCVFIKAEKKDNTIDFKKWEQYGEFYISAITVSELLVGTHLANTEVRRINRTSFVEAIIGNIKVLDITPAVARIHAGLYASLYKNGKVIGAHDLLIAATALTYGYSILTSNHSEFSRIPGLIVLSL
jgi:predicted nucleic acid-binding protein